MKKTFALLAALVISIVSFSQSEGSCGHPVIKFYNLPDELYAGEESGFIARMLSYGYVDTLCSVVYTIYKDDEQVENVSDIGRASFTVRVKQEEYTTVNLTEGSGRLGFRYQLTSFMGFDVYAATLGIFDGYCPDVYNPDNPRGGRDRPFNFSFAMDEYGAYRINFTIYKCNNASININSIYTSFPSYPDALGCCDSNTHNDKASGVCTNPEVIFESDIAFNIVSTKILTQPLGATICEGETHLLAVSAETQMNNPLAYQWYKDNNIIDGATEAEYSASEEGVYYCLIDDGREARRSDDAVVSFYRIVAADNYYLCSGDTSVTIELPEYDSYLWSNDSIGRTVSVGEGEYSVTVVDANVGCTMTKSFEVLRIPNLNIIAEDSVSLCEGDCMLISIDSTLLSNVIWNGEQESNAYTYSICEAGFYYVCAEAYGCQYVDSVVSLVHAMPVSGLDREYEYYVFSNDTAIEISAASDYESYIWSNGEETSTLHINSADFVGDTAVVEYVLTISDNGCITTDTIVVSVYVVTQIVECEEQGWAILPNPNDGKFKISGPEFSRGEIYDSCGRLVCNVRGRQVDVSELKLGVYSLNLYRNGRFASLKLLISK